MGHCSVDGCEGRCLAKNLCSRHYKYHASQIRKMKMTEEDKDKFREYQRMWQAKKRAKNPDYREYQRKTRKANNDRLKEKLIAAYGRNGGCVCCGETERVFLQLDHIYGGGCAHARKIASERGGKSNGIRYGRIIWRDLERKGFPVGEFQILCANCNVGKYRNGGVCPHQAKALKAI